MANYSDRVAQAVGHKQSGLFNCSQAVACSYADITGIDSESLKAITSAFGTGMGNLKGTCGALIGAGVILGLKLQDRVAARAAMKRMMERFEDKNHSTVCGCLKGVFGGQILRDCNGCVEDACRLLEDEL